MRAAIFAIAMRTVAMVLALQGCATYGMGWAPSSRPPPFDPNGPCLQWADSRRFHGQRIAGRTVTDAELMHALATQDRSRDDYRSSQTFRWTAESLFASGFVTAIGAPVVDGELTQWHSSVAPVVLGLIGLAPMIVAAFLNPPHEAHFEQAVREYNDAASDAGRCPL